jgi:hypothetical protein
MRSKVEATEERRCDRRATAHRAEAPTWRLGVHRHQSNDGGFAACDDDLVARLCTRHQP